MRLAPMDMPFVNADIVAKLLYPMPRNRIVMMRQFWRDRCDHNYCGKDEAFVLKLCSRIPQK